MATNKAVIESPPTVVEEFNYQWRTWIYKLFKRTASGPTIIQGYTVATVPDATVWSDASAYSALIYVSDETGGATLAFSDGTNWRRVQDRTIIA